MGSIRFGSLAIVIGLAGGPATALEGLALYDDFSTVTLDPMRWLDVERVRGVSVNTLRMAQRIWGATTSNSGTVESLWTEDVARAGPVTQLRASVRVTAAEVAGCAANRDGTSVFAAVGGTFFNSGNRVPGSLAGDVQAFVFTGRESNSSDPPGVLIVGAQLEMCTDSPCNKSVPIGSDVSLGTVGLNTNVLLQIDWDRANKQFLFSRDKGTPKAVAYTLDDSFDPGNVRKQVATYTEVANCTSGPRPVAYIDAKFDNVAVNAAAKP